MGTKCCPQSGAVRGGDGATHSLWGRWRTLSPLRCAANPAMLRPSSPQLHLWGVEEGGGEPGPYTTMRGSVGHRALVGWVALGPNCTMRGLCGARHTCGVGEGPMGGSVGGTRPSWGHEGLSGTHRSHGAGGPSCGNEGLCGAHSAHGVGLMGGRGHPVLMRQWEALWGPQCLWGGGAPGPNEAMRGCMGPMVPMGWGGSMGGTRPQ